MRAGNLVSICLMSSEIWVSYSGKRSGRAISRGDEGKNWADTFDQVTILLLCLPSIKEFTGNYDSDFTDCLRR